MSQYHAHDNQEVDESGVKRKDYVGTWTLRGIPFFLVIYSFYISFFKINGSVSEWLSKSIAVDHSVK